jgi:hypothetical protein
MLLGWCELGVDRQNKQQQDQAKTKSENQFAISRVR